MAVKDFIPSQSAHDMQLRTRKEHNFDEVEANLPDPEVSPLQSTIVSASGIINSIGDLNPLGKAVTDGDVVWLLDNTAFRHAHLGASWHAEFVAAVFEESRIPKSVTLSQESLAPWAWRMMLSRKRPSRRG